MRIGELLDRIESGVSVRSHNQPAGNDQKGVLKVSALSGGRFNPSENKLIRDDELPRASTNPTPGCTLVSRANTALLVGESAFVEQSFSQLYLPDKLWQLHPKRGVVDPYWVSLLLASPQVRAKARVGASGTSGSMKNISQAAYLSIEVPVPSLREQQRIAAAARLIESARQCVDRLIETHQALKRALAKELLTGRQRFAEFATQPLKHALIADVAEVNPPRVLPADLSTKVSFVSMSAIREDGGCHGLESRRLGSLGGGYTAFADSDVLVAKITPCFENGKGWLANGLENGVGLGSTEFHVIRAGPHVLPQWLYFHSLTHGFRARGQRFMTGSAGQRRVQAQFIKSYSIPVPTIGEQTRIARVFEALEQQLMLLGQLRDAHDVQKRALMHRLLSGDFTTLDPAA